MKKFNTIQPEENRGWLFLAFVSLFVVAFFRPLRDLVLTSYRSDTFSYIPFIPVLSLYLFNINRRHIFSQKKTFPAIGLIPISIGILLITGSWTASLDHSNYLSLVALSMVLIWIGAFALCYGIRSLRAAAFPLLSLLFMVPIPPVALDRIISILQVGSTMAAYGFFKVAGIPIARDGFIFHLPTLNIEVAQECSGINSALSLLITGLLANHFFLRTGWSKLILLLLIVPITILKNGFRIAVLSILGAYVDERILNSELHRNGGILFFILALVLLWAIIALLRKAEESLQRGKEPQLFAQGVNKS